MDRESILKELTIEEKAGLCSGKDTWWLKSVPRLGIESIMMSDGPHGLRKQVEEGDNLGLSESLPAVCYPTASALACSFDRDLLYKVGESIALEAKAEKISVVLGPGVNIKRSPLCGRNFEYFSEDPFLAGELAASMINGMQNIGVGSSLKHFAVNNQETRRRTVNAVVDERALREIYLKAFEIAVKKSRPWTVMSAYNRFEGIYCSENKRLLTDILRNEWGFKGLVVSDWGAVNNRPLGVEAGNDLEMPGSFGLNDKKIVEVVNNDALKMEELDKAVGNVLDLISKAEKNLGEYGCDMEERHGMAVLAAEESAVLLKNEDGTLPLSKDMKIAVVGEMAKKPRYQGTGSSKINPYKIESAWDNLISMGINAEYSDGNSIDEAIKISKDKDAVLVFAGMTDIYESEGFDRKNLEMPESHNKLINELAGIYNNVIVVLAGGAPMELPWINNIKSVLMMYLGGEGTGKAAVNLLFGNKSPSGRLAETWPLKLSDTPSHKNFPGGRVNVEYRESIFVGYRYYDTAGIEVLFPFGHGLSYGELLYSDIDDDGEEVSITVENIGNVAAKESVLLYTSLENSKIIRPKRELKGFEKISLEPGEKKKVKFVVKNSELAYYNTKISDWYVEPGDYNITIGNLSVKRKVVGEEKPQEEDVKITLGEFPKEEFENIMGREIGDCNARAKRPFTVNNNLEDVNYTMLGKLILIIMKRIIRKISDGDEVTQAMIMSEMMTIPFHVIIASYPDMMKPSQVRGILDLLNFHFIKGIKKFLE